MGNGLSKVLAFSLMLLFLLPMLNHSGMSDTSEQLSVNQEYDNYRSISSDNESDAWLSLELLSWQGNTSTTWDADGTDMDVHFQVCIDLDGESDGISPACIWTEVWYDTLTLSNAWNTTFDLIEENTLLNITIECWDNDDFSDEWGNGPDACDMNPDDDEWRLYYEVNWSSISTEDFSGDGSRGNGSQWGNAESTWRVTVTYFGDEDSDGIYDNKDECSNTTLTANVDQWGCYWGDLDYDYDGILNHNDSCPTIPSMTCSDSSGNYSIMNELILSDLTGGYLETATRIKKENDHSNLVTVSYNCNKFEISLLNSSGECKSNEHITGNIASNQQYFAYFEFDGSYPDKIITHWGEWNISGETANFESLTVSDDGRFVIYLHGASVYLWENESVPIKILDITPSGDHGSSTNPGDNLKLSPNGKYFSLSFVGYVGNPKPVYVYDIKNRSGGPIAICDSHDFAHRTSNLICANHDDVTIFDLNTDQMITTYKSEIIPTQGIYFSPSDKYVMQYCRQISVGQSTFCDEEDVNIQVTNLETGLSHYPVLSDSASHSEHINSGGFIYGDHTLYFGVQYYYEEGNRQSIGSSKDLNRVVVFGQDTDSDGVYDLHDLCPNTSLFIGINTDGCSASQRDTDGDGLVDSLDRCPNTDINIAVDDTGCWWGQLDTDDDGIQNSDDLCPEWFGEDCASPEWALTQHSEMWDAHHPASEPNNRGSAIYSLAYSPDGSMLASASPADDEGAIAIVWDSETGEKITTIQCEPGECIGSYSVAFSPDSSIMAVSQYHLSPSRSEVHIFNTTTWNEISVIGYAPDVIHSISFSPNGSMIAYATQESGENRVKIFHTSNWSIARSIQFSDRVYSIDFSPSGEFLAVSHFNQFSIYNASNWTSTVASSQFDAVEFSISLEDVENSLRPDYNGTSNLVTHLEFSSNGLWLITASNDGNIRIWNAMDWQLLGNFPVHYVPIPWGLTGGIAISPDSSTVLSWTDYSPNPGYVSLELNSGNQERLSLSGCGILVFSPNGKILANGESCTENTNSIIVLYEGDSDGDGILDSKDSCQNTEQNTEVNSQGCSANQVDSDGDGVYDSQDLCSDTVSGVQVDQNGCASNQIDSDADGISDASDQCPNTPNGESVGLTGCSGSQVDTDEDGVYDSQDNCPSTPSGTTVDSTGCAPDDVVDLDSDGDGVRDSVDACPNSATGIIVDSTGCETSGDVQEVEDEVSTDDSSDALYGFIGLLVVVGIIAAAVAGIKSLSSSRDDGYDWDYGSYSSVSNQTTPTPQPEPNLELQNVVAELERQRMRSKREINQLKQQQAQQSSSSEIAAMQREMQALQRRVADSEQAKFQLQNEIEQVKIQKDESIKMQDSVVGGDMVASGGQKIESQTNVTGADPETIARIIFEAQEKERERMRKERNE